MGECFYRLAFGPQLSIIEIWAGKQRLTDWMIPPPKIKKKMVAANSAGMMVLVSINARDVDVNVTCK